MKKLLIGFSFLVFHFSFAQTWDSLGAGIGALHGPISALSQYNGNLEVGGFFNNAGNLPVNNVAQWNGTNWDSLGEGVIGYGPGPGQFAVVFSEAVYKGNLYVGGELTVEDTNITVREIAQWNGVKWDSVGSGIEIYGWVSALQEYNSNLYVGGSFYGAAGIRCNNIAQWNGTKWDSVSNGTLSNNSYGFINAFAVYNGELYAAGSFDSIGHIYAKNIARWNDTNWSPVGTGIDSDVNALTVYNGKLYAGGYFTKAGSIPANNIAVWNDTSWNPVGMGISGNVAALTQYGSVLIAGGAFDSAGYQPANNIAYWDGSSWSAMGSGITGVVNKTGVSSLCVVSSTLYIGGEFTTAGGIPANNIAQWRSPLGINELRDKNEEVKVYPNPNDGQFYLSLTNVNEKCSIDIYNVLGQKVFATCQPQTPKGALIAVNLSAQPNGIYLYRVIKEDGSLVGEGEIVIEKQ